MLIKDRLARFPELTQNWFAFVNRTCSFGGEELGFIDKASPTGVQIITYYGLVWRLDRGVNNHNTIVTAAHYVLNCTQYGHPHEQRRSMLLFGFL